jgi:hypothetical protein
MQFKYFSNDRDNFRLHQQLSKEKVIPVIIGTTGNLSRSFQKHSNDIPGKHSVERNKMVIVGTAYILRKILMQYLIVMGPTSSLAAASSLKLVPVKEFFTESRSIVPQLSDGSD